MDSTEDRLMPEESVVKLKVDMIVAQVLLAVARAGRPGYPNPNVCMYLGDCHFRLAEHYRRAGKFHKSDRLRAKGEFYFVDIGPGPEPPYPAAMAMPAPKRPSFVAAIGWSLRKGPPNDAG